jgi:Ca2+:H+ antiporter
MDSSNRDTASVHDDSSTVPSPTDTRAPSRYESITRGDDGGLSESFQSTDTVRRRPEGTYGTLTLHETQALSRQRLTSTTCYTLQAASSRPPRRDPHKISATWERWSELTIGPAQVNPYPRLGRLC